MANRTGTYWDREAGRIPLTYIDMGDGTWALRTVAVNADGSPITAGASANVAKATAAPPVYVEGSNVQLSVDLGGVLRSTAGGGGGAVDVSDRAARLVGVVYGSRGQQLVQTATNFNLQSELAVGGTLIDPRSIRALTSSDVVDVSDRVGRLVGHVTVDNASIAVTIAAAVDVSDRAARLVGRVYGSQGQQLTQTATNFNMQSELAVGGTLIDPRSIRTLTSSDVVDVSDRAARLLGVVDKGKVWDGTNIATVKAAAISVNADNPLVVTIHPLSAPTTAQPVTIAAAVDVSDRAARLVGRVYGSQGQQITQTVTNFNTQVEVAVGGTLVDPRSIRTLTSADVVDVFDRAAREVGRARIWDGTDEATVLPVRTQPATTEKALVITDVPARLATYGTTTITIAPAITIGVKELLALWYTGGTKDIYIVEIWASGIVTTASTTGGRSALRVSTITTAPTGGTEEAKVDITGAGASAITNTMRVKTGGGTIGSTFIRKLVWHATQAIGSFVREPLFVTASLRDAILLRGGGSTGVSIDIEREVAHTALVDSWTVGARWLEL